MKRFILGDIHGMYDYLIDVLKKSNFDYENDFLVQVGDIVDRGPEPFKCMEELMKIKNKIIIMGNHDMSFIDYLNSGYDMLGAYPQNGSQVTIDKWKELSLYDKAIFKTHILDNMVYYSITDDNIMITHGGFDRSEEIETQHPSNFAWDRELVQAAMSCSKGEKLKTMYDFKKIFIGHTPTIYWNTIHPIYSGGVWNIDTGSGKGGPLTIMNIDTEEYWQSEHENIINNPNYVIIKKDKEEDSQSQEENNDESHKEAA